MKEQRQLPRWEIKKKVRVWMPQTQGFSHCIIEDMHLKGMRVSFDKPLPSREAVEISFAIGDNYNSFIKIEVRIPWAKQDQDRYVYGLSFSKIAENDKDVIYRYINSRCYDQFKDKWWA